MNNKKELVKGMSSTYWEIIRYFDDNKNNDQKTHTWNFYYSDQANLVNGTYTPGVNSFNIHANCHCKFEDNELEFGSQGVSYKGTIKKDRMEGTWKDSLNESGGFIGILLNKADAKKIKKSITGNGNASKEQVAKMLQNLLKIDKLPKNLDATDGLAAAVCHFYNGGKSNGEKKYSSWSSYISQNKDKLV